MYSLMALLKIAVVSKSWFRFILITISGWVTYHALKSSWSQVSWHLWKPNHVSNSLNFKKLNIDSVMVSFGDWGLVPWCSSDLNPKTPLHNLPKPGQHAFYLNIIPLKTWMLLLLQLQHLKCFYFQDYLYRISLDVPILPPFTSSTTLWRPDKRPFQ